MTGAVMDVTCAALIKGGRLLLARRRDSGLWELPGGKKEPGEDLASCLERELGEELGIKVEAGRPFATVEHVQNGRVIRLHCFICRLGGQQPKALEHLGFKWVRPGEERGLNLCAPDRELCRRLAAHPGLDSGERQW